MIPFTLPCPTCRTHLRVTKPEAIGLILGCPKCGSMVEIQPPTTTVSEPPVIAGAGSHLTTAHCEFAQEPLLDHAPIAGGLKLPLLWCSAATITALGCWLLISLLHTPVDDTPVEFAAVPPTVKIPEQNQPATSTNERPGESVNQSVTKLPEIENTTPKHPELSTDPSLTPQPATVAPVNKQPDAATSVTVPTPPAATTTKPLGEVSTVESSPPNRLVIEPSPAPPVDTAPEIPSTPSAREPSTAGANPPPEPSTGDAIAAIPRGVDSPAVVVSLETIANAEQPPAAIPLRVPLAPISPTAWDLPLIAVQYNRVPLHRVLGELEQLTGVPLLLDHHALTMRGRNADQGITLQLVDTTARDLLAAVAKQCELEVIPQTNYFKLSKKSLSEQPYSIRYNLDDLCGGDSQVAAQMQRALERLFADQLSADAIQRSDCILTITQTGAIHDQLILWCEQLRTARGLPLRTKFDPDKSTSRQFHPDRFQLASPRTLAEPLLNRPITAGFPRPENLQRIVNHLQTVSGVVILWDYSALHEAGHSPRSEGILSAVNQPFGHALAALLHPLGLTAVPLDARTMLITTPQTTRVQPLGWWYSLRNLPSQLPTDTAGWAALLNNAIARQPHLLYPDVRITADALYLDPTGQALYVRLPEPLHQAVTERLRQLAELKTADH